MMECSISERVALITGGGSGIGRAIVRDFAKAGAAVAVLDVREDRMAEAVEEARSLGVRATGVVADISRAVDVDSAVKQISEYFGRIDILCNNAGITDRQRTALETTSDVWDRVLSVNLTGPFYLCRATLPIMLSQGKGAIVNIASIASFLGGRSGLAYTASKHGLLGLTRSIAVTYGESGIRCNAVSPGAVETDISSGELGGDASPSARALREKGLSSRPSRGRPDQISPLAIFLASDESAYINGQNIVADDGWTAY